MDFHRSSFIICLFLFFSLLRIQSVTSSTNSSNSKEGFDYSPYIRIDEDGRVERFNVVTRAAPGFDPETNVESKDILFSPENNLTLRLYLPNNTNQINQNQKLPLVFYFHGGGFFVRGAFNPLNHNFVNNLASEANAIVVTVECRKAPEHPIPVLYEDSWTALKWVASHFDQQGPEDWLNNRADFQRVFLSGSGAGGNIAHQMCMKNGVYEEKLEGVNFMDLILFNPFFWGREVLAGKTDNRTRGGRVERLWKFAYPNTDDPWINPAKDPNLSRVGCSGVQVFVSENDFMRERGWYYVQKLRESGWSGDMVVVDYKGEDHNFHLANLTSKNSVDLRRRTVLVINQEG
ncbi:hypothetical protein LWI29_016418 [Acer saccharum]|uniref:Alpha/beta hydrolase fold-3 domain-containing protein n=1 Tax=Acer saccharum TaxID=4024 RepID=A0AA39VIG5_ACESA|nr:hypothetical protein LWI29_016418 [Acer saccharum]